MTKTERREAKRKNARKMRVRGRSFVRAYGNAVLKRREISRGSGNHQV